MSSIVYGVQIPRNLPEDAMNELVEYFIPDLLKEYQDDVWCSLDVETHKTKDKKDKFYFIQETEHDGDDFVDTYYIATRFIEGPQEISLKFKKDKARLAKAMERFDFMKKFSKPGLYFIKMM